MDVWISTQFGLSKFIDLGMSGGWRPREREEEFMKILRDQGDELKAYGLEGIVYGPWSSCCITDFRNEVPKKFKLRNYPDQCHTVGCEFPQQCCDVGYSLMHGREPISVRGRFFWQVIMQSYQFNDILGCYSEGISDDFNKYVAFLAVKSFCDDPSASLDGTVRESRRLRRLSWQLTYRV